MRFRVFITACVATAIALPLTAPAPITAKASAPSPAPGTTQLFTRSGTLSTADQSMWGPFGATPNDTSLGTKSIFDVGWNSGTISGGSITHVATPTFDPTPEVCIPEIGCADITHSDDNTSIDVGDFGATGSIATSGDFSLSATINDVGPGNVSVTYPTTVDFTAPADASFTGGDSVTIGTALHASGAVIATSPPHASVSLNGGVALSGSANAKLCAFSCSNVDLIPSFNVGPTSGTLFTANTADHQQIPGLIASATGVSGTLGFPNVVVASVLHPDGSITAAGSDTYDNLSLDVTKWLFKIAGSPLPPHASVPDFGEGISGSYNLVTGQFTVTGTQSQTFNFTPHINVTVNFPTAVNWSAGGHSGFGAAATFPAGSSLTFTVPTNQVGPFQMNPSLTMASNTFSNLTTNRTTTSGALSALGLTLVTPSASWSAGPFSGSIPGVNINLGPAYSNTYPFTDGTDTLWDQSWTLGGFAEVALDPIAITPDPHVTEAAATIAPTEGLPFTNTPVATFTDPDSTATADEYSASISWGDGASGVGTVTATGPGAFAILGGHTYAEESHPTVSVTVTDIDLPTNTATVGQVVNVSDAPLHASANVINSPITFSGPVGAFSDADPGATLADYTASVNWGDGSQSAGVVSVGATGFVVSGSHAYAGLGPHVLTVAVNDLGGATASSTGSLLTYGFSSGGTFAAGPNAATVGRAANFWGAQWNTNNLGGTGPSAFKGFAKSVASPPACGHSWTSGTGNSTGPPTALPEYMAVLVTSSISGGSLFSGNTRAVVVVHVAPGYAADPGHPGVGTVVAVLCST